VQQTFQAFSFGYLVILYTGLPSRCPEIEAAEKAEDKNFSPPCLRRKPEGYCCMCSRLFRLFLLILGDLKKMNMKGGAVLLFCGGPAGSGLQ